MEMVLFAVSGVHVLYFFFLVIWTDTVWTMQLYWPVSAAVFLGIGLLLRADSLRKQKHKKGLSLEMRTFLCVSCILYFGVAALGFALIGLHAFPQNMEDADYLILIEKKAANETLAPREYEMLDCALSYMEQDEKVKIILAGCNRFRDEAVHEMELQNRMKTYLEQQGITSERIITETTSNNLRQNIVYSYAYILVDWYGEDSHRQEDPSIALIVEQTSVFSYRMILNNMGSFSGKIGMVTVQEPIWLLPARAVNEIGSIVDYYLMSQFTYGR